MNARSRDKRQYHLVEILFDISTSWLATNATSGAVWLFDELEESDCNKNYTSI